MKRRIVGVSAAVLFALTGTVVLMSYVRGAEQRALAGERVVTVAVASQPIAKGSSAQGKVELRPVSAKVVPEGAIASLAAISGRVAAVDIVPGEQLLDARFVTPEQLVEQRRIAIPDGLQQVTLALSPAQSLGGVLKAGDLVGIAASFSDEGAPTTHLVLHKILVTNVQGETTNLEPSDDKREAAPTQTFLVTLAVDAGAAERVIFAAEHGSVWLTLQPHNATIEGTAVQNLASVLQ